MRALLRRAAFRSALSLPLRCNICRRSCSAVSGVRSSWPATEMKVSRITEASLAATSARRRDSATSAKITPMETKSKRPASAGAENGGVAGGRKQRLTSSAPAAVAARPCHMPPNQLEAKLAAWNIM